MIFNHILILNRLTQPAFFSCNHGFVFCFHVLLAFDVVCEEDLHEAKNVLILAETGISDLNSSDDSTAKTVLFVSCQCMLT